ncbi:MAG: hypothetical protein LBD53_04360 [Tannerella sp.]|jgi:C-terminal processing protease CtpA/Prc|nr:hypothetical protein [Tannerella sp.]
MNIKNLLILIALPTVLFSCKNDDDQADIFDAGMSDVEKFNKFIVDCTSEVYLWSDDTDWTKYKTANVYKTIDHDALFAEFLNREDRWSFLTDDVTSMRQQIQGVSTTYGCEVDWGQFSDTKNLFAIVKYTSPGSPAQKAGLMRGDVIIGMNGGVITTSNYMNFYNSPIISVRRGRIVCDDPQCNNKTIEADNAELPQMTAVQNFYENPIQKDTILNISGLKVGYLCYMAFIKESENDLVGVFSRFKSQGVENVILDLRYNGGGLASTAQRLASILAPAANVGAGDTYMSQKWNAAYSQWFDNNKDKDFRTEAFIKNPGVNMGQKRLAVITASGTASASEATIIGLKPYLKTDMVCVGDTTHGKYCGAYLMSVAEYYELKEADIQKYKYENISDYGMYIMVYRYANKEGYPSFVGGLPPDVRADEFWWDLRPFGDLSDPMLAVAVERLTGVQTVNTRSVSSAASIAPSGVLMRPDLAPQRPTDAEMSLPSIARRIP